MRSVDSIPEYVAALLEIVAEWGAQRVWYRGQRCASWDLIPSAYRDDGPFNESHAFNVFWARGRGLRDFAHLHAEHEWDWYFAARHHGMATRLLDWSANPFIALYFALLDHRGDEPARVWLLEPLSVNAVGHGSNELWIPSCGEDPFLDLWLPSAVSRSSTRTVEINGTTYENARPIAIYPSHTNARIIAQNGSFTVHGSDYRPLNVQWADWIANDERVKFTAIDISTAAIPGIWRQLEYLGLTPFQVFPDGDHLAVHVNSLYTQRIKSAP